MAYYAAQWVKHEALHLWNDLLMYLEEEEITPAHFILRCTVYAVAVIIIIVLLFKCCKRLFFRRRPRKFPANSSIPSDSTDYQHESIIPKHASTVNSADFTDMSDGTSLTSPSEDSIIPPEDTQFSFLPRSISSVFGSPQTSSGEEGKCKACLTPSGGTTCLHWLNNVVVWFTQTSPEVPSIISDWLLEFNDHLEKEIQSRNSRLTMQLGRPLPDSKPPRVLSVQTIHSPDSKTVTVVGDIVVPELVLKLTVFKKGFGFSREYDTELVAGDVEAKVEVSGQMSKLQPNSTPCWDYKLTQCKLKRLDIVQQPSVNKLDVAEVDFVKITVRSVLLNLPLTSPTMLVPKPILSKTSFDHTSTKSSSDREIKFKTPIITSTGPVTSFKTTPNKSDRIPIVYEQKETPKEKVSRPFSSPSPVKETTITASIKPASKTGLSKEDLADLFNTITVKQPAKNTTSKVKIVKEMEKDEPKLIEPSVVKEPAPKVLIVKESEKPPLSTAKPEPKIEMVKEPISKLPQPTIKSTIPPSTVREPIFKPFIPMTIPKEQPAVKTTITPTKPPPTQPTIFLPAVFQSKTTVEEQKFSSLSITSSTKVTTHRSSSPQPNKAISQAKLEFIQGTQPAQPSPPKVTQPHVTDSQPYSIPIVSLVPPTAVTSSTETRTTGSKHFLPIKIATGDTVDFESKQSNFELLSSLSTTSHSTTAVTGPEKLRSLPRLTDISHSASETKPTNRTSLGKKPPILYQSMDADLLGKWAPIKRATTLPARVTSPHSMGGPRLLVKAIKASGLRSIPTSRMEDNLPSGMSEDALLLQNRRLFLVVDLDEPECEMRTTACRSDVRPASTSVFWDQEFILSLDSNSSVLSLSLFREEISKSDDDTFLGGGCLSLYEIHNQGFPSSRQIVPLKSSTTARNIVTGSVTVELLFMDCDDVFNDRKLSNSSLSSFKESYIDSRIAESTVHKTSAPPITPRHLSKSPSHPPPAEEQPLIFFDDDIQSKSNKPAKTSNSLRRLDDLPRPPVRTSRTPEPHPIFKVPDLPPLSKLPEPFTDLDNLDVPTTGPQSTIASTASSLERPIVQPLPRRIVNGSIQGTVESLSPSIIFSTAMSTSVDVHYTSSTRLCDVSATCVDNGEVKRLSMERGSKPPQNELTDFFPDNLELGIPTRDLEDWQLISEDVTKNTSYQQRSYVRNSSKKVGSVRHSATGAVTKYMSSQSRSISPTSAPASISPSEDETTSEATTSDEEEDANPSQENTQRPTGTEFETKSAIPLFVETTDVSLSSTAPFVPPRASPHNLNLLDRRFPQDVQKEVSPVNGVNGQHNSHTSSSSESSATSSSEDESPPTTAIPAKRFIPPIPSADASENIIKRRTGPDGEVIRPPMLGPVGSLLSGSRLSGPPPVSPKPSRELIEAKQRSLERPQKQSVEGKDSMDASKRRSQPSSSSSSSSSGSSSSDEESSPDPRPSTRPSSRHPPSENPAIKAAPRPRALSSDGRHPTANPPPHTIPVGINPLQSRKRFTEAPPLSPKPTKEALASKKNSTGKSLPHLPTHHQDTQDYVDHGSEREDEDHEYSSSPNLTHEKKSSSLKKSLSKLFTPKKKS